MKYSIISINDKRRAYKDAIRQNVGMELEHINSVDGVYMNRDGKIEQHLNDIGLSLSSIWPLQLGEIGIWMSNYLHWQRVAEMTEPLVVFEDDAIIDEHFSEHMHTLMTQLPENWDFVSLWVPENQRMDYRYNLEYDENGVPKIYGMRPQGLPSYFDYWSNTVAKVYQGYGMVAMMYSPAGGRKLTELAKKYGLRNPVDCFIYEEAHKGALNGFAPKPDHVFVSYDWPETQIHNTEKYT